MDLSPRHLEHLVYIPTAITLSRLNPQPTIVAKSPIDYSSNIHSSLKNKEIRDAQTKAQHAILESRLENTEMPVSCQCQENLCTCRDICKSSNLGSDEIKTVKVEKSIKNSNHKSNVSFNVAKGKGESNMRIRQVTRLTNQISDCIREIEDTTTSTKKSTTKEFITPHELQMKKRRLEEYLNSGRRTLFTLKKDMNNLEDNVALKKDCKWLRMLSSVSRTLHHLLLGLNNVSKSIMSDNIGSIFYKELLRISWRLFSVAMTLGVKFTRQDILKKLNSQFSKMEIDDLDKTSATQDETHESSIDTSSDLLHSSLDDKSMAVLNPNNIRRQIAALARVSLPNKKKKINAPDVKILAPLSMKKMDEDESNQIYVKSKRRAKVNLKRSGSQQSRLSQFSNNDQIEIVPKKRNNVSPVRHPFETNDKMEENYSRIINQKDAVDHHIVEERDNPMNSSNPMLQEQISPEAFLTQIHFLHERVCEINKDWEETKKYIDEFRSFDDEDPQMTHQIILNKAHCLLRELQIDEVKTSSSEFPKENYLIFEQEEKKLPRKENTENFFMTPIQLHEENALISNVDERDPYREMKHVENDSERTFYLSLNTIQDHVRTEKEQFWAALVKQGIVAVDQSIPIETNIIDVGNLSKEKENGKDVSLGTQVEPIIINNQMKDGKSINDIPRSIETLNKKVQTKPMKENVKHLIEKEIQVGSGISESYSSSFLTDTKYTNTYDNQVNTPVATSSLEHPEHSILSNDEIYSDTENMSRNTTDEQLQRNSDLSFLNEQRYNTDECLSKENDISNT